MISNYVGLPWLDFFNFVDTQSIDKENMQQQIKQVGENDYKEGTLVRVFSHWERQVGQGKTSLSEPFKVQLCRRVLLNACINLTDFAKTMLDSEDEYEKVAELYARKQYNAKLLNKLLARFLHIVRYGQNYDKLSLILSGNIAQELGNIQDEQMQGQYGILIKHLSKIISGVHNKCFGGMLKIENNAKHYDCYDCAQYLHKEKEILVEYIATKYSYQYQEAFSRQNMSAWIDNMFRYDSGKADRQNQTLQSLLMKDDGFWSSHQNFDIIAFLALVLRHNGESKAYKIIDYIFDNINKDEFLRGMKEHNLPLVWVSKEEVISKIAYNCYSMAFDRFGRSMLIEDQLEMIGYPLYDHSNIEEIISEGKRIFEHCIRDMYASEYEKVLDILYDIDIVCQAQRGFTIGDYLDHFIYTYMLRESMDKSIADTLCPGFNSKQNVLNRTYILSYLTREIAGKEVNAYLYELYYDIFKFIEQEYGLHTRYQLDRTSREKAFTGLVKLLSKYGVDISTTEYKEQYIISMLDRKVATLEEASQFAELEQLGDGIYDLAVCELLFFNPKVKTFEQREDLISAKGQIKISDKIGLSKLYVDSSSISHYGKYSDEDVIFEGGLDGNVGKQTCYADSLEMVLGTLAKDNGVPTALDFAKQIISETYPNLGEQLKLTNCIDLIRYKKVHPNIDMQWLEEFFARTREYCQNPYAEQSKIQVYIGIALNKILGCMIYGNDTPDKRWQIAHRYFSLDDREMIADYIRNGYDFVAKEYKEIILDKYNK